jgi:hypothetical protein
MLEHVNSKDKFFEDLKMNFATLYLLGNVSHHNLRLCGEQRPS